MEISSSAIPKNKLAAVLVLLYEQAGELHVVLTTRSKSLRTHAGQTACPGGRLEDSDEDLIATAYREANEEVSLPFPAPPNIPIYTVTTLEPFISLHRLVVTPVVALLLQPEKVLPFLKAQDCEVAAIFDHPLRAIQDPDGYFGLVGSEGDRRRETLSKKGTEDWIYDTEFHNTTDSIVPFLSNTEYRMHRFRSRGSPVKGLTSDILIKTAEIAFGESMAYDRYAATQIGASVVFWAQ
ncbi:hypothetical protein BD779DRAFT_1434223 [Infundibulicybe gibba]|nr:hypothetical protein BD779DRAFT_1434223 [Infundibulicybe gibba]